MKTTAYALCGVVVVAGTVLLLARVAGLDPGPSRPGLWMRGQVTQSPSDWSTLEGVRGLTGVQTHQYFFPWLAHSVLTTRFHYNGRLYVGSGYPAGIPLPAGRHWNRNLQSDPRARVRIGDKLYDGTLVYVTDSSEREAVWKAYGPMFWSPGFYLHLWRFEPFR